MTGTFTKCDRCGRMEEHKLQSSQEALQWLTLTNNDNTRLLPAGVYHFCSDTCLFQALVKWYPMILTIKSV